MDNRTIFLLILFLLVYFVIPIVLTWYFNFRKEKKINTILKSSEFRLYEEVRKELGLDKEGD